MARYHLNLFNDIVVIDEEGSEFPDLEAARSAAIESARDLMAEHVRSGRAVDLAHRIEVVDVDGVVVAVIRFGEFVSFRDSNAEPGRPSS